MAELELQFTVNGMPRSIWVDPATPLLTVLRDVLQLTGTKDGCGQGDCGACVVVVDGLAVNACLMLAGQVEGSEIITVEGLEEEGRLHPLQRAFMARWAFQCGYCTPGMLMSCYALLLRNPSPAASQIEEAIAGNLCRCTGYQRIVEAVLEAAAEMRASPGSGLFRR